MEEKKDLKTENLAVKSEKSRGSDQRNEDDE